MGKAKAPRKGKKAWRRNISTAKVEEEIARQSTDSRKGLDFSGVEDDKLFFVDKSEDQVHAKRVASGKKQKKAPKLLKCQAILQGANQARPVEGVTKRKPKGGPGQKLHQRAKGSSAPAAEGQSLKPAAPEAVHDPWAVAEPEDGWGSSVKVTGSKAPTLRGRASKTSRERSLPIVPNVEVDAPGCSYNPDAEQHQDVVAEAVAVEMYKALRAELRPKAPPQHVPGDIGPVDELYALQVDEEVELDSEEEEGGEGEEGAPGGKKAGKKTKTKRNREQAVRQAEKELEERRRAKRQRHELSNLKHVTAELDADTAEQERVRLRRDANEAERARSRTPRLGRTPFANAPIQVLTSDEVEGSLRRLKTHPMMMKDRFLNLQKRGAIETRRIAQLLQKKKGKKVEYDNRASAAKAVADHEEIKEMTRARKKLAKKLKASTK